MALLLAVFQKMRVIREYNEAVRESIDITAKVKRASKNIKNREKWFESRIAQVDSQAKMMQNQANISLRSHFGMGACNNINPYSYNSLDSIANIMMNLCATGLNFDNNGNVVSNNGTLVQLSQNEFTNLYSYYSQNGTFPQPADGKVDLGNNNFIDANKVKLFQASMMQARQTQSIMQQQYSEATNCFAQDISIWVENQKAMIECEKDQELEPLNYEETMLELDKAEIEQRIELLKQEKERYDQLAKEEAQNAAPKFGLG